MQNKEKDYNTEKARKFGEILADNKPQQIPGAPQVSTSMPAYTPEQQDQFGSPLPNVQREPVTTSTPTFTQESPEAMQARQQQSVLKYMQQYGNTPEGQVLLGQLNKQDDRAYAHN
jgi:S-adenosylmethionine hydrolase